MPWVDLSDNDPGGPDLFIRSTIHKCWQALPPTDQSVEEAERQFRRLAERALRDFREDAEVFLRRVDEDAGDSDDDDPG